MDKDEEETEEEDRRSLSSIIAEKYNLPNRTGVPLGKGKSGDEKLGFWFSAFLFFVFIICPILFVYALSIAPEPTEYAFHEYQPDPEKHQPDSENQYVESMNDYLSISPDVSKGGRATYTPGRGFIIQFHGGTDAIFEEQGVAIGFYAAAVQDGSKARSMEVTWRYKNSKVVARFMMTRNEALNLNLDDLTAVAEFCRKVEQRITYT